MGRARVWRSRDLAHRPLVTAPSRTRRSGVGERSAGGAPPTTCGPLRCFVARVRGGNGYDTTSGSVAAVGPLGRARPPARRRRVARACRFELSRCPVPSHGQPGRLRRVGSVQRGRTPHRRAGHDDISRRRRAACTLDGPLPLRRGGAIASDRGPACHGRRLAGPDPQPQVEVEGYRSGRPCPLRRCCSCCRSCRRAHRRSSRPALCHSPSARAWCVRDRSRIVRGERAGHRRANRGSCAS